MKEIKILGKRFYVLTEEEIRDPDGCPLYCIDSEAYCKIGTALFEFEGLINQCSISDWEKELRKDQCKKAYEGLYRGQSIFGL